MSESGPADSFPTRQSLLLRLKADGQPREVAWREFYDFYAPIVGGFARRMGAQPQEVADVVQGVMLGFFRVSPRFEYNPARGRFRGYLKTCAWRLLKEQLATRRGPDGRALSALSDADATVEEVWNDVWQTEQLQRAVATVREHCQSSPARARTFRAFAMYALLERSADEVARELNMKVASVHQARTRISRMIRKVMHDLDASEG